ncbi:mitochondrial carrier [Astrocystis sublimbata]|nr:mitochondrial carrier [Astrocystis sublimbata]
MSADFWAGYISGAAGIIIGNPLDVKKVQLQAAQFPSLRTNIPSTSSLVTGTAAPIVGYGLLNGLLFAAYKGTEEFLNRALQPSDATNSGAAGSLMPGSNLWTVWLAGAVGGLATWSVSTPTELIKCRTQLASSAIAPAQTPSSSWGITREILRTEGKRGLYRGGTVTALRDSIGYGFYFWAYELCGRVMSNQLQTPSVARNGDYGHSPGLMQETARVLFCGGIAGVVSWASIYPLDAVKTRVQRQTAFDPASTPLLGIAKRRGAIQIARDTYRQEGIRAFFRGLGWCSLRAFVVNAVQWGIYELAISQLSRRQDFRE